MALTRYIRLRFVHSLVTNRRGKWTLYNDISNPSNHFLSLTRVPCAAIRAAIVGITAAAEEEARSWSRREVPSRDRNSWTTPRFSARLAAPENNRSTSIIINHRFARQNNHKQQKSRDDLISFFDISIKLLLFLLREKERFEVGADGRK